MASKGRARSERALTDADPAGATVAFREAVGIFDACGALPRRDRAAAALADLRERR
jgi:hypothetical protein